MAAGRERDVRVYTVLAAICGMHFNVEDRAGAFTPQIMGDTRTAIPGDFRGEQNRVLRDLVPLIPHPLLRARIADISSTNDRSAVAAAHAAIDAYCETVDALGDGRYRARFDGGPEVSFDRMAFAQQALQIAERIGKKGQIHDRVRICVNGLSDLARTAGEPVPFARLGTLRLRYRLIPVADLAVEAEAVAVAVDTRSNAVPLATKSVWDLAAQAYDLARNADAARRCRLMSVEETLKMRGYVSTSGAAAHWVGVAITELRMIPGTRDRCEALRLEMRELQERAQGEVGIFTVPMDLRELAEGTVKVFESMTLPTMLAQFALLARPRSIGDLRREARDSIQASPLLSMLGTEYHDEEGKISARAPGAPTQGEPDEEWFFSTITRNEHFWRQIAVGSNIEPARQTIVSGSLASLMASIDAAMWR